MGKQNIFQPLKVLIVVVAFFKNFELLNDKTIKDALMEISEWLGIGRSFKTCSFKKLLMTCKIEFIDIKLHFRGQTLINQTHNNGTW